MAERAHWRTAVTAAFVVGAVTVGVLVTWAAFEAFGTNVVQCSPAEDGRTYTPVCP